MKRVLATTLVAVFALGVINPCNAISDKNDKQQNLEQEQTQNILANINYDWWKQANDSYLEDYILRAIQNNHDIKTSQLNLEKAQINVLAVRANQLPTLSVGASPMLVKMPDATKTMNLITLPINASYELDLYGKNWDKTKSAKKLLEGAQYQTLASEIAIISMVGSIYYNIVKLDKAIEIQRKIVQDRADIYRLMDLSYQEGIASAQDAMQTEKAYVMSQNNLIDFKKARINALNALAVLIGDSPNNIGEYKRINIDDLSSEFDIPEEIPSEIITNRPDYKSIEYQLESAGLDIKSAKKEFLPTIDILGIVAFMASSASSSIDWKSAVSLVGANASLPLFTGFRKTANLKLNKNKYAQILEQYQKTNLTAIQEVNDSLYNYKSDNEKYKNNIKAHEMQDDDFKLAVLKYQEGVISRLELLQQREALLSMEQLKVEAKMNCYIDKISLYKSTGAKI